MDGVRSVVCRNGEDRSQEVSNKYLEEVEVSERGDHIAATAEEDGVRLLACGWADKKRKLTVSSYGCTLQDQPHKKRRCSYD